MKYRTKRGSVGRPLVIKKLKRPEGTITIRYKKIRENKLSNEIINLINEGKGYNDIAKMLGLTTKEVLQINQKNTLRHGSNINKVSIKDMINLGITTKEISQIYICKESDVIAILKDIDLNKNLEIKKEINTAIKVRDMLSKSFDFKEISKELKVKKYRLLEIYNKYFEAFNNEVIDFDVIEKFLSFKLCYDDIAIFYNIPKEYLMQLIQMNEESKNYMKNKNIEMKEKNKDIKEDILTKSYKESNLDFYAFKYK